MREQEHFRSHAHDRGGSNQSSRDAVLLPPSRSNMTDWEGMWLRALARPPHCRSLQDLQVIYYGLSGLEALQSLRDSSLRALCKVVRYEKHLANDVLY